MKDNAINARGKARRSAPAGFLSEMASRNLQLPSRGVGIARLSRGPIPLDHRIQLVEIGHGIAGECSLKGHASRVQTRRSGALMRFIFLARMR